MYIDESEYLSQDKDLLNIWSLIHANGYSYYGDMTMYIHGTLCIYDGVFFYHDLFCIDFFYFFVDDSSDGILLIICGYDCFNISALLQSM